MRPIKGDGMALSSPFKKASLQTIHTHTHTYIHTQEDQPTTKPEGSVMPSLLHTY